RLHQANRPGSYLVRESDRHPGSFVLSFLGKTGVNHFRITAICGDFYIGGRRFSSLSDLIGYYSHISCLLKGEQLLYPVAPLEPVEDRRRVRAILPYTKVSDTDELSFVKGDVFIVHNTLDDGWLWVTNVRNDEQGVIVEDLVEEVVSVTIFFFTLSLWFHGKVSKEEAYSLLMTVGEDRSFLVRPSDNTPGDYSLYFRMANKIQRFKISRSTNSQFVMGGRYYNSIDEVIDHYKKEQIVENHCLKDPVPVQVMSSSMLFTSPFLFVILVFNLCPFFQLPLKNIDNKCYFIQPPIVSTGKNKRWKPLYFVLGGSDAQLFYFENEKRVTKPKGLIDLSVCSIYTVHESYFGRPNCFQIVVQDFSDGNNIFYFSADTQESAQEWMKVIQQFCTKYRRQSQCTANRRLRQVRSLTLYVEEAHKLPAKYLTHPYCTILLNNVQVARTPVKEGQNPVWAEEFVFEMFEVVLGNRTKKSKDVDILFMCCSLRKLANGQLTDEWFQLSSNTPLRGVEPGSLRLKARYSLELIMPEDKYSDLQEMHSPAHEYIPLYIGGDTNLGHTLTKITELKDLNGGLNLRMLFGCLQAAVQRKWPANDTMRTRVVRYLPRISQHLAARTLLLVAKSLQNLANLVEFGAKEAYMEGVNPFIIQNKQRMITFLDQLAVGSLDLPFHSDVSRDLALLHNLCLQHLDELRTLSNEKGAQQHCLKKLLAITEMLQQELNQHQTQGQSTQHR
uniref:RAS p21 protein activator 1 n=1 Tax=Eptatretus burgeri TaxID=7764 RepID=A0A8C4QJF6_EPTBU